VRSVLDFGESRLHALRRGEVAFALVTRERLFERGGRIGRVSTEQEHLGEVGVRVAVRVEQVGLFADRDCFAGEAVGFAVLAAARKNLGPWLPPEHLV